VGPHVGYIGKVETTISSELIEKYLHLEVFEEVDFLLGVY
jgi:hypothetical protein